MRPLRPIQEDFYGDDHRWFFGTVLNSHPPAGLEGRVKVRIYGVHNPSAEEIPERDLPWAQVMIPTTEGGISGLGRVPQLTQGAFVFGIFLDGTASQLPMILGSLPRTELPSAIQSDRRSDVTNSFDYNQSRLQNVVAPPLKDDEDQQATLGLRRQQSMKFFIDNGYSPMHAAAITGALQGASGFQTYGQTQAFGIAKWKNSTAIGSRFSDLLRFASTYSPNSNYSLYSIQLQFVLFELRNRFNGANSQLLVSTDIKQASRIMNKYYILRNTSTDTLAQRAYDEVIA
jgi:hypothetical protein